MALNLQQLTPAGHREGIRLHRKMGSQRQPPGQQPVVAVGELQPFCQSQRIGRPGHQSDHAGQSEAFGPHKPASRVLISLKTRIQQGQASPVAQCGQGRRPGLPVQQQLQLHAQAGAQSRRGTAGGIARPPDPGPGSQSQSGLSEAGRLQGETEARGIAGPPQQPGGIVANALWMQEPQAAMAQIPLAAMGIKQLTAGQIQSDGIDAEITAGQIIPEASQRDLGIFGCHRIRFGTGRGHIEQHQLPANSQLQFDSPEVAVLLGSTQSARRQHLPQPRQKRTGTTLHYQIKIRHTAPGVVVDPMQQQIPYSPAHQSHPHA